MYKNVYFSLAILLARNLKHNYKFKLVEHDFSIKKIILIRFLTLTIR